MPQDLAGIQAGCGRTDILRGGLGTQTVCDLGGGCYSMQERYRLCLSACNNVLPADIQKTETSAAIFDTACCHFDNTWAGWIVSMAAESAALKKKCDEAKVHTGASSSCLINNDTRPDGVSNCCLKEKDDKATIAQDIGGKQCPWKVYEGSDTCRTDAKFGCCICKSKDDTSDTPTRVRVGTPDEANYNCSRCTTACASAPGLTNGVPDFDVMNVPRGGCGKTAGAEGQAGGAQGNATLNRKARAAEEVNPFCFTSTECAVAAGSVDNFKPGNGCPSKGKEAQGYCRSPEPDQPLQNPIAGVASVRGLRNYIALMFNVSIGFIIVAAAIMFLWGAFKYMVSSISSQISGAQETMIDAVIGLALGLASYVILTNIAPNTLNFKPYDVNMINRISFFNVTFCKSITPADKQKFGNAGTPEDPLNYSQMLSKTGFDKTTAQTMCGNEYFVEGGMADSICNGEACPGGGICVNCGSGVATSCKTRSQHEFKCADCKAGGNVLTAARWQPNNTWYYLFCSVPAAGDVDVEVWEMAKVDIPHDKDKNMSSSGSAQGWVTNVCIKQFTVSPEDIRKHGEECKAKGGKGGMLILNFMEKGVFNATTASESPSDLYSRAGALIMGLGPAIVFSVYNVNSNNVYVFQTKDKCDVNLIDKSLPFNQGFWSGAFTGEAAVLEDGFKKFNKDMPKYYASLINDAWTFDEAAEIVQQGMTKGCGFSYSP